MTMTINRGFSKLSSTKFARSSFPFRLKTNHGSSGNKPQDGHWHEDYSPKRKKRGELNPSSFSLLKMSAENHKETPQMGEAVVLRGDNEELMQSEEVRIS